MREHTMKKTIVGLFCLVLATRALANGAQKGLEIQGRRFVSRKPPFTLTLPSELGMKVPDAGDGWERGSIAENERKVYEVFPGTFPEMINTLRTITL